jgi:hypothetical protein
MSQIRQMRQHGLSKHHAHQKQVVAYEEPKTFSNTQVIQPLSLNINDSAYQQELFSLERELISKGCYTQHQQDRLNALRATQRNEERAVRSISVNDDMRCLAQQYDISTQNLSSGLMNTYEYQLHKEFLEQLSQAVHMQYYYDNAHDYRIFIDAVGYGVSCGVDANNNHQAIQATQWANFGWQVLDLAKAIVEGGVLGVYNTAAFVGGVATDPLGAIQAVARGVVTITSFLARATGSVLRLQALEERGYHAHLHAELDELVDHMNVIINHCSEQFASMPLREKVKHVVAFGTEIIVPAKVFKVAHTLCSRMRPMVANMLNIIRDEQFAVEIAGIGGENLLLRGGEEIQKVGSSIAAVMSETQKALVGFHTNLMKNLEPEIAVLRGLFDNKMKGFGEFANKYLKIDYEHILGMELSFNRKGLPKLSGFHHDFMNVVEQAGDIKFVNKFIGRAGVYQADLIVSGISIPEKTFFPAHWARERVVSAIYEAYDNAIQRRTISNLRSDGKYVVNGFTCEGVEIEMFITQKGRVATAYPLL